MKREKMEKRRRFAPIRLRRKPKLPDTRTRFEKTVDRGIAIGGGFMFFNYLYYLMKLLAFSEGLLPFVVSVAVLLLIGGYYLFHDRMKGKAWRILKPVFSAGLVLYTVSFLVMCGGIAVMRYGACVTAETAPKNAVVWVFGAKVNGTTPGKTLKKRLDTACSLLNADADSVCIVSGGKGSDEPLPEAEVMASYLTQNGIDTVRVYIDDEATDTVDNIDFSRALAEGNGLNDRPVICVSTSFHLPRIRAIMASKGIDASYCAAPASDPFTLYACLVREYMSWVKYLLLAR